MFNLPSGITFFERGWLSSNNVLLEDEQRAVLIDTGYCTHAVQTLALIRQVLQDRPLDEIYNTHLHSDHCGGNAALQAQYPQSRLYIPPGNANHVFNWDPIALSHEPTGQSCPLFFATAALQPGTYFDAANLRWDILAAPGHDPHSVIFFNPSHGILVSADALWENGFGVVFPEIVGEPSFDSVEQTLRLIQSLEPRIVLPGHGAMFSDVKSALERAYKRLDYFRNTPINHANYAAKVLIKFKLLELQQISIPNLIEWASRTPYLQLLHKTYWPEISIENWLSKIFTQLETASAAHISNNLIQNR